MCTCSFCNKFCIQSHRPCNINLYASSLFLKKAYLLQVSYWILLGKRSIYVVIRFVWIPHWKQYSQVFQTELGGKRCEEIVKDIDRVFVQVGIMIWLQNALLCFGLDYHPHQKYKANWFQARRIAMDVQVELMQGMTGLHTCTRTLTNKVAESEWWPKNDREDEICNTR